MTPMISQWRNGSVTAVPLRGSPATMKVVTPPARSARPAQPWRPRGCRVCLRERVRAKRRFVARRGSTRETSPLLSAIAPSTMPAIIRPMPPNQRGTRIRSRSSLGERKSLRGACWATFCWSTNPKPRQQAALTESIRTRRDTRVPRSSGRATGCVWATVAPQGPACPWEYPEAGGCSGHDALTTVGTIGGCGGTVLPWSAAARPSAMAYATSVTRERRRAYCSPGGGFSHFSHKCRTRNGS